MSVEAASDVVVERDRAVAIVRIDRPERRNALSPEIMQQLGLKLDPARGPVEVLVIDRVERPSGN